MSTEIFLAFITYAFVTSITPGPNNSMLLASGVNYGFLRSLPHVLGISVGFALMVMAVGAGLGRVFDAFPFMYSVLRICGATYLVYLAWQIATARPMQDSIAPGRPFGFWKAAGFQWVNPKAWIMAIGAISTYVPEGEDIRYVAIISILFAIVNAPSITVWVTFGAMLRHWLTDIRHLRIFNILMAILLLLSLYPLLFQ
ncbi:LysE family translocator [Serratia bockelmannii]|uniref:LysE family translocator n=1 Tax=Serratia bockelmannii TaxID=2703793 RepID=UPI00313BCF43